MEDFFDCYFSLVFSKMDLGNLHDRRKRSEIIDYFKTIIDGSCRAGVCDAQLGSHTAVAACLRNHDVNKKDNGGVCTMGKHHGILHVALKIAYDWRLENDVVKNLLEAIFLCEHTAEKLFVGAFFEPKIAALLIGWRSDFTSRQENVKAMAFILEYATKGKLCYPFKDEHLRIIDYPMEFCGFISPLKLASQLYKADVVTLLLRYGARVEPDSEGNLPSTLNMLDKLQECLTDASRVPWTGTPVGLQTFKSAQVPRDVVESLNMMYRAVPHARIVVRGIESRDALRSALKAHEFVPLSRCGLEPPELKHLSRCAVRKALNENWQLPAGIYLLNVPSSLKNYLDLKED